MHDRPRCAGIRSFSHGDQNRTVVSSFYGANPVEHLLNSLAGCVTTSIVAHAAARGIRIEELESQVEGDIDLRGFLGLAEYSPTFNTLMQGTQVDVSVEPK